MLAGYSVKHYQVLWNESNHDIQFPRDASHFHLLLFMSLLNPTLS